jgi:type VI secretion system secreted protein Hcp
VKRFDKASAALFLNSAIGTHFKKAVITARKAGTKGPQEYLKITLEDVLISNYQVSGDNQQVIPTDTFGLNFAKMEFSYKEQKEDGSLGGEIKKTYNYAKNKEE